MRLFKSVDGILLFAVTVLVVGGLFVFLSASLGLLARDGAQYSDVAISQIVLGLGGGFLAMLVTLSVPYKFWRKYSLYIFIAALGLTLLVFTPLGLELNGARRWLLIGPFTFQSAEALKIAYILYLATWLSAAKRKIGEPLLGIIPFLTITGITGVILLLQPDTDTFLIIAASGLAMFFASGAKIRDIAIIVLLAVLALGGLILTRPYLLDRVETFLDPSSDPQGSSYQIQQSLLAIGAGELTGRGFGQSIQKFGKLPEPISDSIFSVFAEEFGFIGSVALIIAFLTFALRGLWIAARAPDFYGGLLAVGIVTLIAVQAFLNIGAMLGLLPLSGLPLPFVSHGGSALLIALAMVGLLMSVSRSVRT
jgi:cell division protein FtsW